MGSTYNEITLWEPRVCQTAALGRWWCYWQKGCLLPFSTECLSFLDLHPYVQTQSWNQFVFGFVFAVQRQIPLDGWVETLGLSAAFALLFAVYPTHPKDSLLCSSAHLDKANCCLFFLSFYFSLFCLSVCLLFVWIFFFLLGLGLVGWFLGLLLLQSGVSFVYLHLVCLFVCEQSICLWPIISVCLAYCCNTEYFLCSCPPSAEIEERSSNQSHTPLPCTLLEWDISSCR